MRAETSVRVFDQPWNWSRIGSLSASGMLHVAAIALLAMPMVAPAPTPRAVQTIMQWIEPRPVEPPPPPPPDPPQPLRKPRAVATPRPLPVAPPVVQVSEAVSEMPVAIAPPAPDPIAPPALIDAGSGGANVTLDYAHVAPMRYPPDALRRREQGTVLLRVFVSADGVPEQVEILRSSGSTRLDNAARDSIRRSRFRPVLRNGVAMPAWGTVPVAFSLDKA